GGDLCRNPLVRKPARDRPVERFGRHAPHGDPGLPGESGDLRRPAITPLRGDQDPADSPGVRQEGLTDRMPAHQEIVARTHGITLSNGVALMRPRLRRTRTYPAAAGPSGCLPGALFATPGSIFAMARTGRVPPLRTRG